MKPTCKLMVLILAMGLLLAFAVVQNSVRSPTAGRGTGFWRFTS
jgi:hypothetical protein